MTLLKLISWSYILDTKFLLPLNTQNPELQEYYLIIWVEILAQQESFPDWSVNDIITSRQKTPALCYLLLTDFYGLAQQKKCHLFRRRKEDKTEK